MHCKNITIPVVLFLLSVALPGNARQESISDSVYAGLDYAFSLVHSSEKLDAEKFSGIVEFISQSQPDTGSHLKNRNDASGAFHSFVINKSFSSILDYVYNPGIPNYVFMPSSLRDQRWLTPEMIDDLKNLPRQVDSAADSRLLRGQEVETITPDMNTGGYYSYKQDRAMALFPGPSGPVFISVTIQSQKSEVGKKGCVVGEDSDWNYLYSGVNGLNKAGIGWADSFLYNASSVAVYVADTRRNVVRVGSFKWLDAGWAKINMVNSDHIWEGIKRFANDFKTILEAPELPSPEIIEDKYLELKQLSVQGLRAMVSPYFEALNDLNSSALCSGLFRKQLASGEYFQQLSRDEMVRILLIEYVKTTLGKKGLLHGGAKTAMSG